MDLEKQRGARNTTKKTHCWWQGNYRSNTYFRMYKGILNETLFKKRKQKTAAEIESFLSHLNVSNHSEDKSKLSEGDSTEKDL